MKIEATCSSETSSDFQRTTSRKIELFIPLLWEPHIPHNCKFLVVAGFLRCLENDILWRIEPFISNDHEKNKTTGVATQQILNKEQLNYSKRLLETAFSTWSVRRSYITRTPAELQSVESQSVKWRLGGSCEELLINKTKMAEQQESTLTMQQEHTGQPHKKTIHNAQHK
jgi:hypothetical protein